MITSRGIDLAVASGRGHAVAMAALMSGLIALQPAAAQESGTVTVDVARCLELPSDTERRDCFAAQVDDVLERQGPDGPDQGSQPGAAEDSDPAGPTGETGPQPAAAEEPKAQDGGEYFGTIVELRERLPNAYVVTLDNGQVWEQTEPKRYPLRPGLEVRIYPTRWGSRYRLTGVGSGGHIQVQRLR